MPSSQWHPAQIAFARVFSVAAWSAVSQPASGCETKRTHRLAPARAKLSPVTEFEPGTGAADHGSENAELERELTELLETARTAELTPADFLARLESIHARHLGSEANSPELVDRRLEALAAYDEITLGLDRHHELERLARALGIQEELA